MAFAEVTFVSHIRGTTRTVQPASNRGLAYANKLLVYDGSPHSLTANARSSARPSRGFHLQLLPRTESVKRPASVPKIGEITL